MCSRLTVVSLIQWLKSALLRAFSFGWALCTASKHANHDYGTDNNCTEDHQPVVPFLLCHFLSNLEITELHKILIVGLDSHVSVTHNKGRGADA